MSAAGVGRGPFCLWIHGILLGLFQLLGPVGPVEEGDEQQGEDGVEDQQDGEAPITLPPSW